MYFFVFYFHHEILNLCDLTSFCKEWLKCLGNILQSEHEITDLKEEGRAEKKMNFSENAQL